MQMLFNWLNQNRGLGLLLLRLFIGIRLIYGVMDNILHWDRMIEFKTFLAQFHFPLPLVSAIVSVYAQLLAGIMFVLGWKIRYAAILMIINFLVALILVHWGHTFEQMTPALTMLFCSILFLFEGAGKYAIDKNSTKTV